MLTNPRDGFSGHSRSPCKHGTIRYVRYGFLLACYGNSVRKIFDFKECRDLEIRISGHLWSSIRHL